MTPGPLPESNRILDNWCSFLSVVSPVTKLKSSSTLEFCTKRAVTSISASIRDSDSSICFPENSLTSYFLKTTCPSVVNLGKYTWSKATIMLFFSSSASLVKPKAAQVSNKTFKDLEIYWYTTDNGIFCPIDSIFLKLQKMHQIQRKEVRRYIAVVKRKLAPRIQSKKTEVKFSQAYLIHCFLPL